MVESRHLMNMKCTAALTPKVNTEVEWRGEAGLEAKPALTSKLPGLAITNIFRLSHGFLNRFYSW